ETVIATGPTCSTCPPADPIWPASEAWKAANSSHARPSLRKTSLRSTAHSNSFGYTRAQALQNVIAHTQRIGHDRQRRIYRRARWEEAAIHNVKILEIMGPAIHIQRRGSGIVPEADGAVLVGDARQRNALSHIKIAAKKPFMAVMAVNRAMLVLQRFLQLGLQPLVRLQVVGGVRQHDRAVAIDGHAVVWVGKIFR